MLSAMSNIGHLINIASRFPMMNMLNSTQIGALLLLCKVKYNPTEGRTISKKAVR